MAKELLTDVTVRTVKPSDKDKRLNDGGGLYLLIKPNGAKWWRFDYTINGKRKTLSVGVYPDTGLADARRKASEAKNQQANGINPSDTRKEAKEQQRLNIENEKRIDAGIAVIGSFKDIAEQFLMHKETECSASHHRHIKECFERDVYPWLGNRPITDLTAYEVLETLKRITARGALETAHRTKQFIGQAIRWAIVNQKAARDVTQDLRGALPKITKGHYAAITEPKPLGQLLRDIDAYGGNFVVRSALQLQPLIFARPANLAMAEWIEFDLEAAEWRISADKMKMNNAHIVPLSTQAIALLKDIYPLTGNQQYVFASNQGKNGEKHISRESIGAAIRRMGYQGQHTAHGFRTTASTLLHEQGFHSDMIERQLSHAERNKVKGAYNRAQHLPERRLMMQAWANYLDSLKAGAVVIPFGKTG
jgi:integrase